MKKICSITMFAGVSVTLSACITQTDPGSSDIGFEESSLYGGPGHHLMWPTYSNAYSNVPVCFALYPVDGGGTEGGTTQAQRDATRTAVEDTWGRIAGLKFTGWGTCADNYAPNQISVSFWNFSGGNTPVNFGRSPDHATDVRLGTQGSLDYQRYIAIHEFGHALGFEHEQNRPDNFNAQGDAIHCTNNAYASPGATEYTALPDNSSIMSYCVFDTGDPSDSTELSATDIVGVRAAYGSSHVSDAEKCQRYADTYGIVGYAFLLSGVTNFGFAPTSVQSSWTAESCNAASSSANKCQMISDLYGVNAGVTFGFAPSNVQTYWTSQSCNTKPRSSVGLCQRASDTYGIIANHTFGTAPSSVQTWWQAQSCNTRPRKQGTCQSLSDLYGIEDGNVGWAPTQAQTYWNANGCKTSPTVTNRCQLLSDNYGLSPTESQGAAPAAAVTYWSQHACSTSPISSDTCQRAADLYGIDSTVATSSAPSAVQTWWTAHSCSAKPVLKDVCQTAANRFGIRAGVSFGAAPTEVQTWWVSKSCSASPRDVVPIPE